MSVSIQTKVEVKHGERILGYFSLSELRELHRDIGAQLPATDAEIDDILQLICNEYHITLPQLRKHCREYHFVWPRFVAMSLIHEFFPTLPDGQVAAVFGKDRSLAVYARHHVKTRCETEPRVREELDRLRGKIPMKNAPEQTKPQELL